jgi:serine/threonine protein kinase
LQPEFPQKLGAYVLLGPLSEGGMGAVYLAMSGHQEMETLCVVKRLLPALRAQPEHVRRFRHEADLARRLVHGTLVHTHNVGEVAGEVFLVQEFVEGHDVSALLDELARGPLPVPVAVHIASEVARGLAYAHAFEHLELVHRDINPPNIRLTYSGEVKLLDFGIASSNLHGDARAEHRGAGKLWYLAPEQVRPGTTVDRRADIYALGLVLWELLTRRPVGTVRAEGRDGRLPETEGEILTWIARGEHQAPSAFNAEVPPELDALVAKATHVNPEYRHNSAEEFRRELADFLPPGFHPEPFLAALLEELFSPEAERNERQRLVEAGRHLLQASGAHHHARRRASDVPREKAEVGTRWTTKRWPWLVGLGIAALAGLLALIGTRVSGEHGPPRRRVDAVAPSPAAAPTSPAKSSAPPPVSPSPAPALRPPVPEPPPKLPEARVQPAAAPAPPEPAAAPAKLDHLRLAREAFNSRDWPRALAEGRSAVAQGGGAEAHALLGNTYFKMGRFVEAEQAYAKAAALEPRNSLLQERLRIVRVRAQQQKPGEEN